MTDNQWPFKRCTGTHCLKRENCVHHALPTTDTNGLIWPNVEKTGENCDWFVAKTEIYGSGGDSHALD